jgi:uncharacterized protein YggT (Ycf19 family)
MGLIDFILNLASLLLWLNWCSVRFDPLAQPAAKTLLGTLRRAGPSGLGRWKFLTALAALLIIRPVFYWQIGSALNWTPTLNLAAIVLPFRSEFPGRMFLFSFFSFGIVLAVFYLWLLFLTLVNRRVADADPFQKLVRAHLGRVGRWHWLAQLLLPLAMAGAVWLASHPLLVRWGIIPASHSTTQLIKQATLIGLGAYLPLKYLVAVFLFARLLTSYVYLGNHPVWNFVNVTARNLLAPLRWAPLRLGKVDFAALAGIALVFLAAEFALHWLPKLYTL